MRVQELSDKLDKNQQILIHLKVKEVDAMFGGNFCSVFIKIYSSYHGGYYLY